MSESSLSLSLGSGPSLPDERVSQRDSRRRKYFKTGLD